MTSKAARIASSKGRGIDRRRAWFACFPPSLRPSRGGSLGARSSCPGDSLECSVKESLEHLEVDLADAEDIRRKLPSARLLLEAKRRQADEAQHAYAAFRALYERLAVIAGEREDDAPTSTGSGHRKASPAQDAAVAVVQKAGRPMSPARVAAALSAEGFKVKTVNAVNSALYTAFRAGRLSRPSKGLYAPPDYRPESEDLLASQNGAAGGSAGSEGGA